MRDTRPEVSLAYRQRIAALSGEDRLAMAADLYATGRNMVRAGILARRPDASEADVRKQIFLRFYENDVPQSLIDRTLRDIDERFAGQPAVPA